MKKYLFSAILLIFAVVVNAQPYHHSLGFNVGSSNGITYKGYVRSSEHFVVQCDINYQLSYAPQGLCMGAYAAWLTAPNYSSVTYDGTGVGESAASSYQAVVANANLMYQAVATSGESGTLNWFIGGGIDVGTLWGGMYSKYTSDPWLKIGEHVITGIEYCFSKAPVILGFDFRPGMATATNLIVDSQPIGPSSDASVTTTGFATNLFFDWGVNLSVRFRLGK